MSVNSFGSRALLAVLDRHYVIHRLDALDQAGFNVGRLPFSLRILLENLLRTEDGVSVERADIEAIARWNPAAVPSHEIAFMPSRVLMQDFTGVPAVVDLASMRDAMQALGGDPGKINPLLPAELVIDHSVQVDAFGTPQAFQQNAVLEFERNRERYGFLRWGQIGFRNFAVVPPETGICHQVNLEYLARVVFSDEIDKALIAYPDTLVGTDSHTTMINGLGVLGWGVGGIEAEAAMLGQPMSMLIPQVVGFRLSGRLREGATATDLVLTVTEMLRKKGVVGKFVEFYGPGVATLPIADRATIANMAPEYGATCGIFPVDGETLRYLTFSGRPAWRVQLVEAYMKEQGLFHTETSPEPVFSETLALDLDSVEPSVAGPKRPQDRVRLKEAKASFLAALPDLMPAGAKTLTPDEPNGKVRHGSVVIAAITSCTNTSNPSVMVAAGLLARKAVQLGLMTRPWVKTSLAPGSKVVSDYLQHAGLMQPLETLGFHLVGYGCTTCIGNSGPLPEAVSAAIRDGDLVVASVLSGNRNFEGRVQQEVRANYLMSPPLVVAFALAGRIDIDLYTEPLGRGRDGKEVFLKDIWPTVAEVDDCVRQSVRSEMFIKEYAEVFLGDEQWNALPVPQGDRYAWDPASTYIKRAPYFDGMPRTPGPVHDLDGARVLAYLGDSITTDHISPAGSIKKDSPAGKWLIAHGVEPRDFNSYGARRGHDEVMVRGTFANVRIRNRLAPGTEGGVTRHLPDGEVMSIFDAAVKYRAAGVPLIVLAGKEYGSGSSRDWAAKGPRLLGIRAVIAESYERIHRSNLVGMGVLPLQFASGDSAASLELRGDEVYAIGGVAAALAGQPSVTVHATRPDGTRRTFHAVVRIDTPKEKEYFRHGGILEYVLRQLAGLDVIKLVLLRHGESEWNRENRFTGWTDVGLSQKGAQEAHDAARWLTEGGYGFDLTFTSVLKRAIKTLWIVLEDMDLMWLPEEKSWKLNERHYGALTGLDKAETAAKFGEAQVKIWRRSYDTPPPALDPDDPNAPSCDPRYQDVPPANLPLTECLKDTVARVVPYWEGTIAPALGAGKRVLIAAHGNSLRALVKYLDQVSDADIVELNIPTGIPLVYELDEKLAPVRHYYLGDPVAVRAAQAAVAAQGKARA